MLFVLLIVYYFALTLFFVIKKIKNNKVFPLPELKFEKNKIIFCSHSQHKIFVGQCNVLNLKNNIYLKKDGKMIALENVLNARLVGDFLFFTGNGEAIIKMKNLPFARYLQMNICSYDFDLKTLKRKAEIDVLNNLFDFSKCKDLLRYIRFLKFVLNIQISKDKLQVKQNNYRLKYSITYNFGFGEKIINFNQST